MIAIINYNAGNTVSVQNALWRLNCESIVTNNPAEILNASKVILPGVGEASSAMRNLKQKGLDEIILRINQPFLGICLGLQLLCKNSEEGDTPGLGIFDTNVHIFPALRKVPHVGWNSIKKQPVKFLSNIESEDDFYFVHSFYASICDHTIAKSNYILPFSAVLKNENYHATQFHPEKSGSTGEQLLKNFLEL